MKIRKNEELQSRRDFFKKAAKGALPIIAGVILSTMPNVAKAMQNNGCNGNCKGSCMGHCEGCCAENGCKGTCSGTCHKSCTYSSK